MRIAEISKRIVSYKWWILALVLCSTLFLGYQIKNIRIDADVLGSLPDSDPDAVLLKRIGEKFGGNRMGIVILETDNVYRTEVLEHVRAITDTLANMEGISSVSSLTNIINIRGGDMGIEIGNLVDEYELPQTEEDFEALRESISANAMYKGSIVSEDETSTLIVFTLSDDADLGQVAPQVLSATASLNLPEKLYYIGSPMLVTYIGELMKRDLARLLPIAFLLIAVILYFSFRSFRGVALPLLTAVIAIVWSLGLMALFGYPMSMISNNIPIILLAVGSAYTIHVVNRIEYLRQRGDANPVAAALTYVMIPVILAAVTTAIGFLSFIFGSYLQMIRDFGVFTAVGTFVACLMSLLLVPALLAAFGKDAPGKKSVPKSQAAPSGLLAGIQERVLNNPGQVLIGWLIVLALSITGVFRIERSVDIQDYFKKGNPTREAERIMIEKFGGTKPVFVHFKGNMQDPEVLQTMMRTSEYMEASPEVHTSMSVAKLLAEINLAITGNREVPEEEDMVEQLWFLLEGNEVLGRMVSEDLSEGIIISKFRSPDNRSKKEFAAYMEKFIRENSSENCEIRITGMPFVDLTMDQSLVNSQIGSISIAIVFVILIVGLVLRSLASGVYAALPIIAAILILFGVMGLTGIPLNIATVLVASVALGIGIDYSIHVISHFNDSLRAGGDPGKAMQETMQVSGKAILINVVSVSAGFLVLVFSEMVPLQYFGSLIALSMVSSSFAALTLLPALLLTVHRKKTLKTQTQ